MRRKYIALLALGLTACTAAEPDIVTNGYDETVVDGTVRHAQGFRVVDMDGDGNLDVVAALSLTDAVHLYLRQEDLTQPWERISVSGPSRIVAMDVDVGDIDGDGNLDIVAVGLFQRDVGLASAGDVVWYRGPDNNPRGIWTTHGISEAQRVPNTGNRIEYIAGTGTYGARAVKLADIDGDGDLDVVVGALEAVAAGFELDDDNACVAAPAQGNGVYWFSNRGNGAFDGPFAIDPELVGISQLTAVDVDADGRLDLLVSSSLGQSIVWYRNAAGAPDANDIPEPSFIRYTLKTGAQYFGMQAVNMDDDDALEIVTVSGRATGGYINIYDPPADLTAAWGTSTVAAGIGAVACANDDECPRAADFCATVQICTTTATAAVPADGCVAVELCDNGEDENGDGLIDCDDPTCALNPLCAVCVDEQLCATNPVGQLDPSPCTVNEDCPRIVDLCSDDGFCGSAITNPQLTVADFTADGRMDIMVGDAGGLLRRYYRQEDGSWQEQTIRTGYTGINYMQAADIDGNGCTDLLTSTYELGNRDRISWWRNVDCIPQ